MWTTAPYPLLPYRIEPKEAEAEDESLGVDQGQIFILSLLGDERVAAALYRGS